VTAYVPARNDWDEFVMELTRFEKELGGEDHPLTLERSPASTRTTFCDDRTREEPDKCDF
jgi:hypothetical protein